MKGIKIKNKVARKKSGFPIVAIGASAGGLEAMTNLLKSLSENTGFAFVYIQHLDPTHESMLTDILGRVTKMPVLEAKDKLQVKPNHVYIIPPNREMALEDGHLHLTVRPARPEHHLPINHFFVSLADHYKEKAIGVLLSGNPPDGTLGLKSIRAAGGITFAQDSTAKFQGMPRNAISEEAVDLVLSPQRIGEELGKLSLQQEKYLDAIQALGEESVHERDATLLQILRQIHRLTGVDFGQYKPNTIKRRIMRRMILLKMESLEDYDKYLKLHTNEIHQLYQDLLINVTSFFRDDPTFNYLKKTLLPKIIKLKSAGDPIRVWIPACSTGQEAYSLAIVLMEVLGEIAPTRPIQVFATDLSEVAINKARLGIYSKDEVSEINPKRIERFFMKVDGSFRVIKPIRDLCVFAIHNVLKDPPFSRLDLISCCNLMIYLESPLQKKLMSSFHYSLNPNGYLILGKAETIGASANLFSQVDKKYKIYAKKKDVASKAVFELSPRSLDVEPEISRRKSRVQTQQSEDLDLDKAVEQLLLKKYTPACVVVNNDLDIIQFRGSTGLFLEPTPGKASLNLLKMARAGLGFELRNLVHKAARSGGPEEKSWTEPTDENRMRKLSIEAIPLKTEGDGADRYYLVICAEEQLKDMEPGVEKITKDRRVKQLEGELSALREDMRTIVEEQEAANEELQSVNEEIVSSNEELQSINEELETSKEELESSNEELITINQELIMRNEQLAEIQEYSEAVFTTIRESLLILDKNFRVKNANSCFFQTFHLTEEETRGKLLYELDNHQWNIPKLRQLLEDIIPRNAQMNNFEVIHVFPGVGEKIMILNARRLIRKLHGEQLILLAIEDITNHRHAEQLIAEKEAWFRKTADEAPMMIWVADAQKKIQFVNRAWLEYRNRKKEDVIGEDWMEHPVHPKDEKKLLRVLNAHFKDKKPFTVEYRLKQKGRDYRWILSKANPAYDTEGKFTGFIGSCVELPGKLPAG